MKASDTTNKCDFNVHIPRTGNYQKNENTDGWQLTPQHIIIVCTGTGKIETIYLVG